MLSQNGSVQSINGTLTIDNAYGQDTINVDDGTDGTGRNVTLDTVTPASDPVPFGAITGLGPASINYEYSDTKSIGITLGVGGNTVNVHATGAPTTLRMTPSGRVGSSATSPTVTVQNAPSSARLARRGRSSVIRTI